MLGNLLQYEEKLPALFHLLLKKRPNNYPAVRKVYSTLMTGISTLVSRRRGNVYSRTKRQEVGQVAAEIQA